MFYTVSLDALDRFSAVVTVEADTEENVERCVLEGVREGKVIWHDGNGRTVHILISENDVSIDWIEVGNFGESMLP